jgi:hypothetical protein
VVEAGAGLVVSRVVDVGATGVVDAGVVTAGVADACGVDAGASCGEASVSLCALWLAWWTWAATGGAGVGRMAESILAGSSRSLKKMVAAVG